MGKKGGLLRTKWSLFEAASGKELFRGEKGKGTARKKSNHYTKGSLSLPRGKKGSSGENIRTIRREIKGREEGYQQHLGGQ